LRVYFQDNCKSHILTSAGTYKKRRPDGGKPAVQSQLKFHTEALEQSEQTDTTNRKEFTVRRKPPKIGKPG
jgi:hypothetical protein